MPDFRFQSITNSGEVRSGILKGRDRADVVQQLSSQGETATKVNKVKQSDKITSLHHSSKTKNVQSRNVYDDSGTCNSTRSGLTT